VNAIIVTLFSSPFFDSSLWRILTIVMGIFCLIVLHLQAAPILVTDVDDSGTGSLRQALADENNGDTISVGANNTITVTLGTGEVLTNKSPTGTGPSDLATDATLTSPLFYCQQ
jgi:hypothetical protein